MVQLTLKGEVVADFPEIFLGDMVAIADQVEVVNAIFAAVNDQIVAGLKAVKPILDVVNALQRHRGAAEIAVDLNTLPRADQANIIRFFFDLLLTAGLQKSGEPTPGTVEAAQPSADQQQSESESRSASELNG